MADEATYKTKSTKTHYGIVAISLHWSVALLTLMQIASGLVSTYGFEGGGKINILKVHGAFGMTILLLTVFRIVWWKFFDRKPDPHGVSKFENGAARLVHILLYAGLITLAVSGIGIMFQSGAGGVVFLANDLPFPDLWDSSARNGHFLVSRLLIGLIGIHALAALFHQFVRKDRLLARMGINIK